MTTTRLETRNGRIIAGMFTGLTIGTARRIERAFHTNVANGWRYTEAVKIRDNAIRAAKLERI